MTDVLPQRTPAFKAAVIAATIPVLVAWEGLTHIAKHERIDPPGVITVCFGRTNYDDKNLKAGDRFTTQQCEQFLAKDLYDKYYDPVAACINVPVGIKRMTSYLDLAYNIGPSGVCHSQSVRELNAGHVVAACNDFDHFERANGVFLPGLANRRKAEQILCRQED